MAESEVAKVRAELEDIDRGYLRTQALYVAAKLGVADVLQGGPMDAGEVARRVGAHPQAIGRLLRALASFGVFTQDASGRFGLGPMGELLRTDHPESLRHRLILFGEEPYRMAGELLAAIRTGEAQFPRIYGVSRWGYLADHPEASATFHQAMLEISRGANPVFKEYDFSERRVVVDVGGGRGQILGAILAAHQHLKGILFDLPQGVAGAPSHLASRGVADRCTIVAGDMFESVPRGGDAYILSQILHDWPDAKAAEILARVREVIPRDGVLLIRDAVLPAGDAPSTGKLMDLNMLVMLGGAERTEAEWRALLEPTGFSLSKVYGLGQREQLLEARPI